MSFDISNYTTVNQRIIQFYDLYENGVISTHPAKVIDLAGHTFISVMAEVYTTPDAPPVLAEAWEVFPGKTPYTRDSEMMNAATSAIGRALMQLGIGIDKAAASVEEVKARSDRPNATEHNERQDRKAAGSGKGDPLKPASEKQIGVIRRMLGVVPIELKPAVLEIITGKTDFDALTNGDVQAFFDGGNDLVSQAYEQAAGNVLGIVGARPAAPKPADDDPWAVEKW